MSVSYSEAGMNLPTFSQFRILLRLRRPHEPSNRPPGRPPWVRSRQADTVAEEANEKVRHASRKGPRSAESAWISSPMITRFWMCCTCLLLHNIAPPPRVPKYQFAEQSNVLDSASKNLPAFVLALIFRRQVGEGGERGVFVCCLPWSFDRRPRIPFETEHRLSLIHI